MFERSRPKRHFLPSASSVFVESWEAVQAGRGRVFSRVLRRPVRTMLDFNGFEDPSPSDFFTHNRRASENNFGASASDLPCTRGTERNNLTTKLEETFRDLRQLQEAKRETDKVVRQLQVTRACHCFDRHRRLRTGLINDRSRSHREPSSSSFTRKCVAATGSEIPS